MKEHIAIIGAGNGGQAFAGYLSLLGERVRIFDVVPQTVQGLNERGGVLLEGNSRYTGFGKIERATGDMGEAVEGAKLILVVLPALYHGDMARKMAPYSKTVRWSSSILMPPWGRWSSERCWMTVM